MGFFSNLAYGLQVAAIGLVVVFAGLGILIGCLYAMAAVFKSINARNEAKAAVPAPAAPAPVAVPAPVEEEEEFVDDPELIAVIAAAIAAFDDSGKALVVRKVRRVGGWNRAARSELVSRF